MRDYLYLSSFIISAIIIAILSIDLKFINEKLYQKINYKLFIKSYALLSIFIIHLLWIFYTFLTEYKEQNYFYGIPPYLLIAYIILAFSSYSSNEYDKLNELSKFINKYLNYIIYLYFICIIIVILIPNKYKKSFMNYLIHFMNSKILHLTQ
jgi:hypothetical protein